MDFLTILGEMDGNPGSFVVSRYLLFVGSDLKGL